MRREEQEGDLEIFAYVMRQVDARLVTVEVNIQNGQMEDLAIQYFSGSRIIGCDVICFIAETIQQKLEVFRNDKVVFYD